MPPYQPPSPALHAQPPSPALHAQPQSPALHAQPQSPTSQQSPFQTGQTGWPPPAPWYGARPAPYQPEGSTAPAGWQTATTTAAGSDRSSRLLTIALLGLGALLSLGYAVWAFTARRGIFQDFADGRSVTVDDAETSDALDTIFLVVAGLIVLIAVGWWLSRMLASSPRGGVLERVALALALLGAAVVVVGLVLTGSVSDAADRVSQGENGITATAVMGGGFALLAVGLLAGLLAVVGQRGANHSSSSDASPAAPGW